MAEREMKLAELKEMYSRHEKKHKLPSFEDINNNFEIEKIERESDILLRIVRVVMMDKIIATERFAESILVPGNAPRALYSYLKSMSEADKKAIEGIYDKLARLTLDALELDIEYNEAKEAEMIKKIFSAWEEIKKELNPILARMKSPSRDSIKREKSYFG